MWTQENRHRYDRSKLRYLFGAGVLQSAAFFTPIALHAALGLVVLFLGVLALRPDTGWMALLSGDRPGAACRWRRAGACHHGVRGKSRRAKLQA